MLFFMPGAVVIRDRRDEPVSVTIRKVPGDLSFGNLRGFKVRPLVGLLRGPEAGGDDEEQPLYLEAGAVRREVLQAALGSMPSARLI